MLRQLSICLLIKLYNLQTLSLFLFFKDNRPESDFFPILTVDKVMTQNRAFVRFIIDLPFIPGVYA